MAPKKGSKKQSKPVAAKKAVDPLYPSKAKTFGIGGDIRPQGRDLSRFVKWPKYVRIQRQQRVLMMRLKMPAALNIFSQTLDKNLSSQLFKLLNRYKPENKVMKKHLPAGACAVATLLLMNSEGCKLYQAGARTPLMICQRGEVLELNAEGIALGLDDGPVFEKSLRPQPIEMSPGVRLVFGNEALLRAEGILELLPQHSPRHTNMFMNMILGGIEQDAGSDGLREDVVLITVKKESQE